MQVVGALDAVPAVVAVHREEAPDDARDAGRDAAPPRTSPRAVSRNSAPLCGSVSRPSVKAWMTRSSTPASAARVQQRVEMVDARVHAAVGDEREDVHARRRLQRLEQHRVAAEARQPRGLVDERQVLLDDRARAEVEVADLGVAHLPVGQPDGAAAGGQRRVRVALPERVEDRRVRPARRRCPDRPARVPSHRGRRGRPRTGPPRPRLRGRGDLHGGIDDAREGLGIQRGAADERAVDVGQREQLGRAVGRPPSRRRGRAPAAPRRAPCRRSARG